MHLFLRLKTLKSKQNKIYIFFYGLSNNFKVTLINLYKNIQNRGVSEL